jgi:hypothetical protein
LEAASRDADQLLDEIGKNWGEKLSHSTSEEIGKHGHDFTKAIEESTVGETIRIRAKTDFYNVRDSKGRFTRRVAEALEEDIEDAFHDVTRPGGPFSKIGQAIADAIGAGFNISGRSPLIVALVPVIAAIVGLVAAAVQTVNALIASLTVLPALISSIAIQFAVLKIATTGVADAISAAFSAKDAKEMAEAVKSLTPSAREFVLSLLPAKDLFKQIRDSVQENFFHGLGNIVSILVKTLGPDVLAGLSRVAHELGFAWSLLLTVLSSREFQKFLDNVFISTVDWISRSTPALVSILKGLIAIGDAAIPFLNAIGLWLSLNLEAFGDFLQGASGKDFTDWLSSMLATLEDVGELLGQAIKFVAVFLDQLDKAGGKNIIKTLADAFEKLSIFFASPAGAKAMEAIVDLSIAGIKSVTGLIALIGLLLAGIEVFGEWLNNTAGPAIAAFFQFIGQVASDAFHWVIDGFVKLGTKIKEAWDFLVDLVRRGVVGAKKHVDDFVTFFKDIPKKVKDAVANFGTLLIDSGKHLIQGLIDGIKDKIKPLQDVLNWVTNHLPDWKGPEEKDLKILEPSGRAVMTGFHNGIKQGVAEIRDSLTGFTQQMAGGGTATTNTQSIMFAPNAINISFMGNPSPEQAYQTGEAVGAGINAQLSIRNVNLGVRRL